VDYAFLGGGNMGYALAAALIQREIVSASHVLIVDPSSEPRHKAEALGCKTGEMASGKTLTQIGQSQVVVLAVKPQGAGEALAPLKNKVKPDAVVVSIMAGVKIGAIQEALGHKAVVRVMPNTPSQVGLGMSVFHADPSVTEAQLAPVEALFKASGEALAVPTEDLIDAATAVSASGPAYVFYMAEHWIRAAQELGFSEAEAVLLVRQTLLGATSLWQRLGTAPGMLREQVTSKGGTTAAALDAFRAGQVGEGIETGVRRAYERAKELGR
jgi:pyrroline-5-carboxylate reductase